MFGQLLEVQMSLFRGRRMELCTLSKVSKTWGFCSISKNDGRRGTFEEDLQRCIFRSRRSTRDIFIRATLCCTNYTTLHYATLRYATNNYIQLQLRLHYFTLLTTPSYTTLDYTPAHHTTLDYTTAHNTTAHYTTSHYTTLMAPHHSYSCNYTTLITLHNYNSTTLQLQLRLPYTTLHPALAAATIAATPKTQLQPPFGPSVDSLCHPCITTTHLL